MLLPEGTGCEKTWSYPYLDAKDCGAFVFDVHGDGSGRTLVLCVKSPREFTSAISEHRVKIDFTGRRRITFLARERDAAPDQPLKLRYAVYRNKLCLDHISAVSVRWDEDRNAPLPKIGDIRAVAVVKAQIRRPAISAGGKTFVVPFELSSGEFAELENGMWTHYSDQSAPLARAKGEYLEITAGDNVFEWKSPHRAEVTLTAFGEETEALKPGADMPEYIFAEPLRHAPCLGFDSSVRLAVADGERRQTRLEILGAIDRPTVTVGEIPATFPVTMRKGDRLLCRDGRNWLLRDEKRRTLATGVLTPPLPVLSASADASVTGATSSSDVRVLFSTRKAPR
jgi:hypothetical protein